MIGDTVNLAARLMGSASKLGKDVICCETTFQHASGHNRFTFEELEPQKLKGKEHPVKVFVPIQKQRIWKSEDAKTKLVGRDEQIDKITATLKYLAFGGSGNCMLVEGETGMGKSSLVDYATNLAKHLNVYYLIGSGDSIDTNTPFYAWHGVLKQLFGFERSNPSSPHNREIWSNLEEEVERDLPQFTEHLSLLKFILTKTLPLDKQEEEQSKEKEEEENESNANANNANANPNATALSTSSGNVNGKSKKEKLERLEKAIHFNTRKVFKALLQKRAASQPIILIIEDVQWLDDSSLLMLREVAEEVCNLMLLMTLRPSSRTNEGEFQKLKELEHVQKLSLPSLDKEQCGVLCKSLLDCQSLDSRITEAVYSRVQGNPFFITEFTRRLKEQKLVKQSGGHCELVAEANIVSMELPTSIQGIINSRIDKLHPNHLMVLKVASVFGNEFSASMLLEVFPLEDQLNHLSSYLSFLANEGFLSLKETDGTYVFKHVIIQECAYNLLLFQQRLQLHQQIALKYEDLFSHDLSPYYNKLSYHWNKVLEGLATSNLRNPQSSSSSDLNSSPSSPSSSFSSNSSSLSSLTPAATNKIINKAIFYMQRSAELNATSNESAFGWWKQSLQMIKRLPIPQSHKKRVEKQLLLRMMGMDVKRLHLGGKTKFFNLLERKKASASPNDHLPSLNLLQLNAPPVNLENHSNSNSPHFNSHSPNLNSLNSSPNSPSVDSSSVDTSKESHTLSQDPSSLTSSNASNNALDFYNRADHQLHTALNEETLKSLERANIPSESVTQQTNRLTFVMKGDDKGKEERVDEK